MTVQRQQLTYVDCFAGSPDESGPSPRVDADPSQSSEAAASFANDAEVDSDDNAANDAEVNAGSSPVASEHHLVNSQGLLNPPPPPADLPVCPPTVMQSSQDFSLLSDYLDGDEAGDAIDEEFVDADDVDSVDNPDSSSQELDSIAAKEAIPLAAAVKRGLPQRKVIGCRNPGKLSSSLSVPSRKPTAPLPVSSRKRPSAGSSVGPSKSPNLENAPT